MNKTTTSRLPSIFGFSNLAWIMSYYNYLDQWKKVLMWLSTYTWKYWKKREIAFINYGSKLKRNVYIRSSTVFNIQPMISDKQLFNKMLIQRQIAQLHLGNILMSLKSHQELIMHQSTDDINCLVLYFWEDNESTCILPALDWWKHKQSSKKINQSQLPSLIKFMLNEIRNIVATKK